MPDIEVAIRASSVAIYPHRSKIFAALQRCQPENVKIVLLGQDPYHTPGKADGLAFSIPDTFQGRLDSLGNIFKELEADLHLRRAKTSLDDWADQGILLLNTALTVPEGQPKAHARLGWEHLVSQVLDRLADRPRAYMLWGGPAQKAAARVDPVANLKIETAHPSPLSAHRGFFGSRPFSKVNQWLKEQGHPEINWAGPS